ncbi:hypothetical protein PG995_010082 [Apiospora arundinis]
MAPPTGGHSSRLAYTLGIPKISACGTAPRHSIAEIVAHKTRYTCFFQPYQVLALLLFSWIYT